MNIRKGDASTKKWASPRAISDRRFYLTLLLIIPIILKLIDSSYSTAKTLIVTSENNQGPISKHAFALYRELVKMGWHVIVLIDQTKVAKAYVPTEGMEVRNWPSPRATKLKDALFLARLIFQYRPFGVIGVYGSVNISLLVSFLFGVPVRLAWYCTTVETLRHNFTGPSWKFYLLKWRKKMVYQLATGIITIADGALQDFQNQFWRKKPWIRCHCLNPDPQQQASYPELQPDSNYITFIGRLSSSKDPYTPIKAIARLQPDHTELKLYILGDGPLRKDLEAFAAENRLTNQINFMGSLTHPQVYQVLSGSKANLCTSFTEAFGKVNTQALGMGVPIIATRVEGIKDILKEGYNGYGIEPGDDETAAACIHRLLADPEHQQTLAKQARKDFEERFMLENNVTDQAQKLADFLSNKA